MVRRGRSEDGATAVEFALVMIPLIVLIFGIVQYGLYFWAMQGGSDIARSAARLSAVGKPPNCVTNVTDGEGFTNKIRTQVDGLTGTGSTAEIHRTYTKQAAPDVTVGDTVTVTVKFRSFDFNFPFIPFIDNGEVTSTAEARVDFVPKQPEAC